MCYSEIGGIAVPDYDIASGGSGEKPSVMERVR